MFTGLIEETGKLRSVKAGEITVFCGKILEDMKTGDSVSINGVCLSAAVIHQDSVSFHVSPTTARLSRFNPGDIRAGEMINLERAVMPQTRLGGHIVTGHIDGVASVIDIKKSGADFFFEILTPAEIKKLIIPKGSVAIDGISLTISHVLSGSFTVTVIPQTFKDTNLREKKIGDKMHIEADLFARYVFHILNGGSVR